MFFAHRSVRQRSHEFASIGLPNGIIDQGLFSILVFIAMFTTALVPVTVKWGVDWLESINELVYTKDRGVSAD